MLDPSALYPLIDTFKGFLDLVKELVEALGGGKSVLAAVVGLLGQLFSKNLAQQISNVQTNAQVSSIRKANMAKRQESLALIGAENSPVAKYVQYGIDHAEKMTPQGFEGLEEMIDMKVASANSRAKAKEALEDQVFATNLLSGSLLGLDKAIFKDDNGDYNNILQLDVLKSMNVLGGKKGFDESFVRELDDDRFKEMGYYLQDYGVKLQEVKKYQDALDNPNIKEKQKEENIRELEKAVKDLVQAYRELNEVTNGATEGTNLSAITNKVKDEVDGSNKKLTDGTKNSIGEIGSTLGRVGEKINQGQITKSDVANPSKVENFAADYTAKALLDDTLDETFKGFGESQEAMERTEQFIKMTSAISELTFA